MRQVNDPYFNLNLMGTVKITSLGRSFIILGSYFHWNIASMAALSKSGFIDLRTCARFTLP